MGICLDTEPKPVRTVTKPEPQISWNARPPRAENGHNRSQSNSISKQSAFESPKKPVIFVLGGPGSGKITHSETLVKHRKGFVHFNMTAALQEYADGTGIGDIGVLPTSKVTNALMAAFRNHPNSLGYIVSGYPRNMRDVSDYLEKIGRCDGVILLNWHDMTLERQIEYGARQGEIELEVARMELKNFRMNVIPVAEYFDYKQLLYVVSGERKPEFIYSDFLKSFEQILESDNKLLKPRPQSSGSYRNYRNNMIDEDDELERQTSAPPGGRNGYMTTHVSNAEVHPSRKRKTPYIIWVVGGPGCSKAEKLEELLPQYPTWKVISVGRAVAKYLIEKYPEGLNEGSRFFGEERQPDEDEASNAAKNAVRKGDLVPQAIVMELIMDEIYGDIDADGFFIAGFPKDIMQAQAFESRTGLKPPCVLIDCSEQELGRSLGRRQGGGRIDDTVDAFRRRLELYRERTLPMLKTFDEQNRLKIVDGDSDPGQVSKELRRCIHREVAALKRERVALPIEEDGVMEITDDDVLPNSEGYLPVDDVVVEDDHDEDRVHNPKKVVRHYDSVDPEVEAELKKVIEEMQQKNGEAEHNAS